MDVLNYRAAVVRAARRRYQLTAALTALMRDQTIPDPVSRRTVDLAEHAQHHQLELAVLDALARRTSISPELQSRRDALRIAARTRRLNSLQAIRELTGVLGDRFIVVKGPVAAQRWWPDPDHRDYGDVDILVDPGEFSAVFELLESNGFAPLLRNWHGFARRRVGEVPLGWRRTEIDLHWDLVALGSDRRTINFDVGLLFERSLPIRLGETQVRTLDDADTLLHQCVNAGLGGARRLRALVEIHRAFAAGTNDESAFVERARSAGAHALCAAVLQRCRRVLSTPVPDDLLDALEPWSGWLATSDVIDRWSPLIPRSRSIASGLWVSSGRSTFPATLKTAAWATGEALAARLGSTEPTSEGGELDWQRICDDAIDEPVARDDYLAWVDRGRHLGVEEVDARFLEHALGPHEPRSTVMIGAARDGVTTGRARSHVVVEPNGNVVGALTTYRWMMGHRTAYPLLLDIAAAVPIVQLIDQLGATDMAGFDGDVLPLRPLLGRWRRATPASAASLEPGFTWEAPAPTTRRAVYADLDRVTDLIWHHAPHGFPNRWALRRRVRRALDDLVIVVERGSPPAIVGVAARDSVTASYHCWALMTIDPEWRGRGLSWELVAHAAAEASATGAGALTFAVASNPMPIPVDAHIPSTWWYVALEHPNRITGEQLVRRVAARTLSTPARRQRSADPKFRTPGARDQLTSDARTQSAWRR